MKTWAGRRLVVTAGPTREPLDPVRYLSNESSGRMGWALANAASQAGAHVTLITGPVLLGDLPHVKTVHVTTAREMLLAVRRESRKACAVIGAAAVADWRPEHPSLSKLKKEGRPFFTVKFVPNPDILKTLTDTRRGPSPLVVGFALETENLLAQAKKKMVQKNLDLIIANPPASLGGDKTKAWILSRTGEKQSFTGTKTALAQKVLKTLLPLVKDKPRGIVQ